MQRVFGANHLSFKMILLALSLMLCVIFVALVYTPLLNNLGIKYHIPLTPNFGVDLYGLIIPLLACSICAFLYFKGNFPKCAFFFCLLLSILLVIPQSRIETDGLGINSLLFIFPLSVLLVFFITPLSFLIRKKSIWNFKEVYQASMLMGICCFTLSATVIDIKNLTAFSEPFIGGNGLADGLFLTTLYSPIVITLMFSLFVLLLPAFCIIKLTFEKKKDNSTSVSSV